MAFECGDPANNVAEVPHREGPMAFASGRCEPSAVWGQGETKDGASVCQPFVYDCAALGVPDDDGPVGRG